MQRTCIRLLLSQRTPSCRADAVETRGTPWPPASLWPLPPVRSFSQHSKERFSRDKINVKPEEKPHIGDLSSEELARLPKSYGLPLGLTGPPLIRSKLTQNEKFATEANLDSDNVRKYKQFWLSFVDRADAWSTLSDMSETESEAMLAFLDEELARVQQGLVCDVSLDSEEKKVLTISADGNVELFPFVLGLVKHAPFSLERKGWKLVAFRQRTDPSLVEEITMGSVTLKFSDVEFAAFSSTDDAKVALELCVLQGKRRVSAHVQAMVFQMLFEVLGEWDVQALIGSIFFVDQFDPRTKPVVLPLPKLSAVIDLHCSR